MDSGEFKIEQVECEVDPNDFIEVTQTDTVKHVPCKVNVFSKCGSYEESHSEREFVDHTEVCENVSTDECNTKQMKNETNTDIIFYEDIKREIGEENSSELSNFCEVCNKRFSSETEFIHSKNNGFECNCRKQNDSINLHGEDVKPSLIITKDFGLQPFVKPLVIRFNNKFKNEVFLKPELTKSSGLESHEIFHSEEKPFLCKICSKTFKERRLLKAHEGIHTVKKPFHCKICSKTFIMNSSNLKVHERIHAREKPFYCKICSKYFRSLKNMKDHERTHTGEKPFYCKICSMTFSMNPSDFKIHERIHTGEKPFYCKICSKYFSSLQYVKVHEKTHTREKQFHHQLKCESS